MLQYVRVLFYLPIFAFINVCYAGNSNDIVSTLFAQSNALQTAITQANQPRNDVMIFLSLRMPENALKQWIAEARTINAPIMLRGLENNSLLQTSQHIRALSNNTGNGMQINPKAFEDYQVTVVPALVVTGQSNPGDYDIIYGNASLTDLLDEVGKKGTTGKETANVLLSRLREKS